MASVKDHYDNLLAPYYSWLSGGFELKIEENRKFFQSNRIRPALSGTAVDLGAGCGFQSIPLAQSGFEVIAIDLSHDLLAELKALAKGLSIVTIEDNLLNFAAHIPRNIELIVCMGDTLTHLQSLQEVQTLLEDACRALEENGRLILGFRDLSAELKSLERFIPVRSSSARIFTCFLEYEKNHVKVHDIIHEKSGNRWVMKKSYFRKLRISPQWVNDCLLESCLAIEEFSSDKGMITIVARKPEGFKQSLAGDAVS
ncbi:MAG: methyltransferase domain-containing protein [Deltaproteobacteria bacterium]|jgi:2-polyprenyl-3-methyl-5-hydroxy-6-metoxy-1,4-benzoquinol methylase